MTDEDNTVGAVARKMVSEDARWIVDALVAARQSSQEAAGVVALLLIGHSSRIVYEGSLAIRSADPDLGVPSLASELKDVHADVITRSRHATKLLDDTKKSLDDLQSEMGGYYARHRQEFTGNSAKWARFMERDLGLYSAAGRLLGATIPLQFRMGLLADSKVADLGQQLYEISQEHGSVQVLLSQAAGDSSPVTYDADYGPLGRIEDSDVLTDRYLSSRYDTALPLEAKLLLLMIEGELNVSSVLLPFTEARHPDAVFRARTISLIHALSGIQQVLERFNGSSQSPSTQAIRAYLSEPRVQRLLGPGGPRNIRNRCMHYEIKDKSLALDTSKPMNGIVEAVYPNMSFGAFNKEVTNTTTELSEALRNWTPQ
jgi:hypothetical protein